MNQDFECPRCGHCCSDHSDHHSDHSDREWQGLTDEEINSVRHSRDWTAPWTDATFARAIEQALKDKNT